MELKDNASDFKVHAYKDSFTSSWNMHTTDKLHDFQRFLLQNKLKIPVFMNFRKHIA